MNLFTLIRHTGPTLLVASVAWGANYLSILFILLVWAGTLLVADTPKRRWVHYFYYAQLLALSAVITLFTAAYIHWGAPAFATDIQREAIGLVAFIGVLYAGWKFFTPPTETPHHGQ